MVMRRNPRPASCRTTTSRIGYWPMGMRGLGRTTVYGRSRVPIPPARITARSHIVEMALIPRQILGTLEPVDGGGQALAQRRGRSETCRGAQLRIVAAQAADLTLTGTKALGLGDRHGLRPHQIGDQAEQVTHADFAIGADLK